jgi:UDP-N-acetylglucosamine diphosphorylase/glucosamine-1-phosphate N-acetyltransferase
VVLDSEHGAIHVAEHAVVRPGAVLIGPCYVGPHSTVLERATIRPGTAIGPWCKVNGEVGGTIFQGYANKAHDGYLGDAYVGEWVNLGAGTTVSNLLNTYSEVIAKATPGGSNERTGETFLGPVIGDHVKTAICTRVMTGSILHTGSMFATTAAVSGCVGPFTWATDEGQRVYRLDKFLEVARAAMERRKVEPSEAYIAALAALHAGAVKPR